VETEALTFVSCVQSLDRITRHRGRRRHIWEKATVRPPESKRSVRLSIHVISLLVYRTVVPATQHREVGEGGGAAIGPVTDVMALAERQPAAGEAAPAVAMMERAA
jgi:hypothetical protein